MSFQILRRVMEIKVRSSEKLILLGLANCADDQGRAYPSIKWLREFSGQDRKTVIRALANLGLEGHVEDTGERRGVTRQVVVYKVTVPNFPQEESQISLETVPKTGHGTYQEAVKENQEVKPCVPQEEEHPMNAQEVQEALKAQAKKALAKPEESLSLTHVVRSYKTWVGHYLGVSVGAAGFTAKEGAILKNALKKYPGLAVALWYACTRWPEFSAKVASDHGLKVLPNYPTPLWVAAYLSDLAAFADECSAKPPPSQESKWKDL